MGRYLVTVVAFRTCIRRVDPSARVAPTPRHLPNDPTYGARRPLVGRVAPTCRAAATRRSEESRPGVADSSDTRVEESLRQSPTHTTEATGPAPGRSTPRCSRRKARTARAGARARTSKVKCSADQREPRHSTSINFSCVHIVCPRRRSDGLHGTRARIQPHFIRYNHFIHALLLYGHPGVLATKVGYFGAPLLPLIWDKKCNLLNVIRA